MNFYLIGRAARLDEIRAHRDELRAIGHEVSSTWLDSKLHVDDDGTPLLIDDDAPAAPPEPAPNGNGDNGDNGNGKRFFKPSHEDFRIAHEREQMGKEQYKEIRSCDTLIAFCDTPNPEVDSAIGLALGMLKSVILVGQRHANLYHLPGAIRHFEKWDELVAALKSAGHAQRKGDQQEKGDRKS